MLALGFFFVRGWPERASPSRNPLPFLTSASMFDRRNESRIFLIFDLDARRRKRVAWNLIFESRYLNGEDWRRRHESTLTFDLWVGTVFGQELLDNSDTLLKYALGRLSDSRTMPCNHDYVVTRTTIDFLGIKNLCVLWSADLDLCSFLVGRLILSELLVYAWSSSPLVGAYKQDIIAILLPTFSFKTFTSIVFRTFRKQFATSTWS